MSKRTKQTTFFPTKIPISSLSGGVGRQAPNKRLPNEAENLDNILCTTERSIDKRNGFELVEGVAKLNVNNLATSDVWWYWYNAGAKRRYLIGIDTSAQSRSNLMYVYKIDTTGVVAQAVDTEINTEIFEYLTYGTASTKDKIRACSVGSSILVLNTEVKAGFTSDGDTVDGDDFLHDLDGTKSDTLKDTIGLPLKYLTSVSVDPEGEGEVWTEFTDYVWGQTAIDRGDLKSAFSTDDADDEDGRDTLRHGMWRVIETLQPAELPGPFTSVNDSPGRPSVTPLKWERVPSDEGGSGVDAYKWSEFISPADYIYPNPLTLHFGQSVGRLSALKFPLKETDLVSFNGDDNVRDCFKALYPGSGNAQGKGKLYNLSQAYLSSTPGFYRAINNTESPYLEKIRTPDEMSVIDNRRMPMQIFLDTENNRWSIRKVDWNPRTSGTVNSNPGPSFFKDNDGKSKQIEIKAISFYRDRLFLATEDTLVSSELGDFSNFFLKDPANIVFTDPIDLDVSSNVFTPITFLKPFKDFLLLGTSGDTQYELVGSENQISPLTAEIAPTSFFPMTEDVEPMVMNNNLFFFSKRRLFIYFQRFESAGQQAFELSRHVPDYLPDRFWDTTVSTAHNMILAIGGETPSNKIYCYRNQVQGERIVQNAFFTFTLPGGSVAETINSIEDDIYIVVRDIDVRGEPYFQVQKMSLIPEDLNLPRIDSRVYVEFIDVSYDATQNQTTLKMEMDSAVVSINTNIVVFPDGSH